MDDTERAKESGDEDRESITDSARLCQQHSTIRSLCGYSTTCHHPSCSRPSYYHRDGFHDDCCYDVMAYL